MLSRVFRQRIGLHFIFFMSATIDPLHFLPPVPLPQPVDVDHTTPSLTTSPATPTVSVGDRDSDRSEHGSVDDLHRVRPGTLHGADEDTDVTADSTSITVTNERSDGD